MSGTDFYYEHLVQMSERLSKVAPMKGASTASTTATPGAEAVEQGAIKVVVSHTGRQHIISFLGSFHGRTMGAPGHRPCSAEGCFRPPWPPWRPRMYPDLDRLLRASSFRRPARVRLPSRSGDRLRPLHRGVSSRPSSPLRKSPSSLSPSRAKETSSPRTPSSASCAASAIAIGILLIADEVRSSAPHRGGGPSNTPACSRTSSASPRASPAACRWASA